MRRIALLALVLLPAVPALSVSAQSAPLPAVGTRVRLKTPTVMEHPQLFGRITAVDSTAVTIHTDLGEDTRLPRTLITEVAVSQGTSSSRVSVVRGAFAGLVLGVVAGRLSIPEHRDHAWQTGLQYSVRGGLIGSLAGAMFGAVNRPEQWDAVVLRNDTLDPPPR